MPALCPQVSNETVETPNFEGGICDEVVTLALVIHFVVSIHANKKLVNDKSTPAITKLKRGAILN